VAASTLLDNLKAEILTAQKHSAQLRAEAEGQTKKILENREEQLEELEQVAVDRLKPIVSRETQLKESVEKLRLAELALETSLVGLNSQLASKHKVLDEAEALVLTTRRAIEEANGHQAAVLGQIDALQGKIGLLQGTIQQLQDRIDALSVTRDKLKEDIDDFTTDFEVVRAEKARAVTVLDSKREHLEVQIIQMQDEFEAQRNDIARRTRAADDREEVLKRRETKAARDEAVNRRNAQLMNL